MKTSAAWVSLLCTLAISSLAFAGGGSLSVGKLSAAPPANWTGQVADGNLVFQPKKNSAGEITVLVSEGASPARSIDELSEQTWNAFASGMTVTGKKMGPSAKTRSGFDLQLSFASVTAQGEKASLVVGALLRPGAQAVVVVFMKNENDFEKHGKAIGELLDSINVSGGGATAQAPSTTAPAAQSGSVDFPAAQALPGMGKGVAGAWAVLRTGARASVASMTGVDLTASWDVFVLLPDGRYTTRLHPQGLNGKSAEVLTAQWPQYWGTYQLSGKNLTLRTSNGIVSTYRLSGKSTLVPTGRTSGSDMVRADTGSDLRLSGTYGRYNIGSKTYGNEVPVVVFNPDGTFEDRYQGVYTVIQNGREWKGTTSRGKYRIHNNTLYLAYDNGQRSSTHLAVLPTGGTKSQPKGLYVGDYWMTRR